MKKVSILAFLVVLVTVGVSIGRQLVPYPGVPSDHRAGSRYWANINDHNTGGPGELVVDGIFGVGVPDIFDHTIAIRVLVSDGQGNLLFDDLVGNVNCPAAMSYRDFPVHRVYPMPPGQYKVKLIAYHGKQNRASSWRSGYIVL